MATPYQVVFDSFLQKVRDDEWCDASEESLYIEEWTALLHDAMAFFKFPRFDTTLNDENKTIAGDLTNEEIQILGHLMKQEWLDTIIHSWEQVKMLYDERDFSPANMLAQLIKAQELNAKKIRTLQKTYSRSILGKDGTKKSFDYSIFGSAHNV